MNAKEKAIELVEKFKPYVFPYSGSGMLVNQEDPEVIKKFAKDCALITVNKIINALENYDSTTEKYLADELKIEYLSAELQNMDSDFRYWNKVKQEVELL